MATRRYGMTLLELLVVIGILGILVAILLPAVQYVRESSRRMACQNNLRQQVLAVQAHESAHARIPSLYYGTSLTQPRTVYDEFRFHSWQTAILPQLEQIALFESIDLSLFATDAANQASLNTRVAVYLCPSTPNSGAIIPDITITHGTFATEIVGTAERTDYEAIGGVHFPNPPNPQRANNADLRAVKFGSWGEPKYGETVLNPISYRTVRFRDVSDGLSNTISIGERAGRPDSYQRGEAVIPYNSGSQQHGDLHQAARGISTHIWWLILDSERGGINEWNAVGIFGFHTMGANVGLADGSVRFLSESMDQNTLNALATRSAGDIARHD